MIDGGGDGGGGFSETARLVFAALSGGVITKAIDSVFRWRGEQIHVQGSSIEVDIKASGQWKELYAEEQRLRKELGERVDDLEGSVHRLMQEKLDCHAEILKLQARVVAIEAGGNGK